MQLAINTVTIAVAIAHTKKAHLVNSSILVFCKDHKRMEKLDDRFSLTA